MQAQIDQKYLHVDIYMQMSGAKAYTCMHLCIRVHAIWKPQLSVGHQERNAQMSEWVLKDWLEALAYVVAIVGGLSAAAIYVVGLRSEALASARQGMVRSWTNEGDITSRETRFVTMNIQEQDGDLIGSLSTNAADGLLDISIRPGWFSSRIEVFHLQGRNLVQVATVKVKLTGNNNRLSWSLVGEKGADLLPTETTLWPSPVGAVAP